MSFDPDLVIHAVAGRKANRRGWVRGNCPFCEIVVGKTDRKQCLGLNTFSARYHCWRCGTTGWVPNFDVEDIDRSLVDQSARDEEVEAVQPPEGFLYLGEEPAWSSLAADDAWRYLLAPPPDGRGLTEERIVETGIGVCLTGRYQGRVIVPVLGLDGDWLWWVGRSWVKKADRPYMYPSGGRDGVLYNHASLLVETDEPVAVVEGVFDAIALWPSAVAVLGKPNEAQIDALATARRPVAVVLDGDAWSEGWALAMRLRFEGQRAGNVRLPPKKDPDEVPLGWLREEMRACLDQP
jgi:hypothetical protein